MEIDSPLTGEAVHQSSASCSAHCGSRPWLSSAYKVGVAFFVADNTQLHGWSDGGRLAFSRRLVRVLVRMPSHVTFRKTGACDVVDS